MSCPVEFSGPARKLRRLANSTSHIPEKLGVHSVAACRLCGTNTRSKGSPEKVSSTRVPYLRGDWM